MNPIYFETHIRIVDKNINFPNEFVIITAFATTGERWSEEQNKTADQKLYQELKKYGEWLTKIEGFTPRTDHSEDGWAACMSLEEACEIGLKFKQDAIYHINNDILSVSFCDQRRDLVRIGSFSERLKIL